DFFTCGVEHCKSGYPYPNVVMNNSARPTGFEAAGGASLPFGGFGAAASSSTTTGVFGVCRTTGSGGGSGSTSTTTTGGFGFGFSSRAPNAGDSVGGANPLVVPHISLPSSTLSSNNMMVENTIGASAPGKGDRSGTAATGLFLSSDPNTYLSAVPKSRSSAQFIPSQAPAASYGAVRGAVVQQRSLANADDHHLKSNLRPQRVMATRSGRGAPYGQRSQDVKHQVTSHTVPPSKFFNEQHGSRSTTAPAVPSSISTLNGQNRQSAVDVDEQVLLDLLFTVYGHREFRSGQKELLRAVCVNRWDALGVLATATGKSAIFQLPALFEAARRGTAKVVICISPLISLMQDQVRRLNENADRLRHVFDSNTLDSPIAIHLQRSEDEQTVLSAIDLENGFVGYRYIYMSPERLAGSGKTFLEKLHLHPFPKRNVGSPGMKKNMHDRGGDHVGSCVHEDREGDGGESRSGNISLIAIDEAHCIPAWGHDFRTPYLKIGELLRGQSESVLKDIPILALTATAPPKVRKDIHTFLKLREKPQTLDYVGDLYRENLNFEVVKKVAKSHPKLKPKKKGEQPLPQYAVDFKFLVDEVRSCTASGKAYDKPTVIYVPSRDLCDEMQAYLDTELTNNIGSRDWLVDEVPLRATRDGNKNEDYKLETVPTRRKVKLLLRSPEDEKANNMSRCEVISQEKKEDKNSVTAASTVEKEYLDCSDLQHAIQEGGVEVLRYHACVNEQEKERALHAFQTGVSYICEEDEDHEGRTNRKRRQVVKKQAQIIVATSAFGMGVDKRDIRQVFHWGPPRTVEAYVQESGRGGRDGNPCTCKIFWGHGDFYRRTPALQDFCKNETECRQHILVRYLIGEQNFQPKQLQHCQCDNCATRNRHRNSNCNSLPP
ncbi:unnamed protein product, partial [Amoebophrya sp. A25]